MHTLTIEYSPKREEFSKAIRTIMMKNNEHIGWIMIVFYLPITILYSWQVFAGNLTYQNTFLFLLIAFPAFFSFFLFRLPPIGENLLKLTQWTVDENGLLIKTPQAETKFRWDVFQKVLETRDFYFLIHKSNKNCFEFLPKRAFVNNTDEGEFLSCMRSGIGEINDASVGSRFKLSWIMIGLLFLINIALLVYSNFRWSPS